jgi:hypothetical protein
MAEVEAMKRILIALTLLAFALANLVSATTGSGGLNSGGG